MAEQKSSCGCGCVPQQQICGCGCVPQKQKKVEAAVPGKTETEKKTPEKSK
ncbi:MAG: hypothetical protein WC256_02910 [Desulfurivibrionaceae bacterium]|jgi:hypothetical protein